MSKIQYNKKVKKSIKLLCEIANVSRSGYYKWLRYSGCLDKDYNDYLLIRQIFEKGKSKLGWRQIKMHLEAKHNIIMNHKKIKRIKIKYNLITRVRRKNPYKNIMKKSNEDRTFSNILNRNFKQTLPDKVFCTDITYLYYGRCRKAYLQVIKDIATKEIVSYELSNNCSMDFVLKSVDNLKRNNYIKNETIIHSDQGVHYSNPHFIKKVKKLNLKQSMSRKGNCIDNSPIETFFGHFKDEVDYRKAKSFDELKKIVSEYMNYYNNERFQWELKKMTPAQYRNHLVNI